MHRFYWFVGFAGMFGWNPRIFFGAYGSEVVCEFFLMRWILVLLFEVLGRILKGLNDVVGKKMAKVY